MSSLIEDNNRVPSMGFQSIGQLNKTLFVFAAIIGLGSLLLVIFGAITNYDSLTTHLTRVMYYRQFGKIGYYGANYWAQDIHPFVLPAIQLALLRITQWENSVILVQWFSLFVTAWFIKKSTFELTQNRVLSNLAGLLIFLFVNPVVQSSTTQNDLFLTSILAIQLWIALSKLSKSQKILGIWFLLLLGFGVKQTFILYQVPLIFVLFWKEGIMPMQWIRSFPYFRWAAITLFCAPIFLFHFIENYKHLGNINGFQDVIESHSFTGKNVSFILVGGSRNVVRYFFDFFTLDGMNAYPWISDIILKCNNFLKWNMKELLQPITGDLEKGPEIRVGFFYLKRLSMEDSSSFWGPIGPLLIFPAFVWAIGSWIWKRTFGVAQVLSVSLVLFLITQAYSSFYDMWRGRYFNEAVPFAIILATLFIHKVWQNGWARGWIYVSLLISAFAAFGATYLRTDKTILWHRNPTSIFSASREEIMTRRNSSLINIIKVVKGLPENIDSIGLHTSENMPEYILFDMEGKRKYFPMNSYRRPSPWRSITTDATIFTEDVIEPKSTDLLLGTFGVNGERLFLRQD